jgi:hypothetical protein
MPPEGEFCMSTTQTYTASVVIFFHLEMPLPALKSIFPSGDNFTSLLGERIPAEIAPGLSIGPSLIGISKYKNTRIEYVGDRYMLRQNGPISELVELNDLLPSLFEKQSYALSDLTRFCEFDTYNRPLVGKGIVDWIREKVKVDVESLSKTCHEELKPFMLWLSNSDTPLTNKWLNIMLQPDINSPHDRLLWRIIKRTENHKDLTEFLKNVDSIIREVGRIFGAK